MKDKLNKKDFVKELAFKMNTNEKEAENWLNSTIDVFYDSFKARKSITIENFGNFYIQEKDNSCAGLFNFHGQ